MNLHEALYNHYGCAIYRNGEVVHSVEHLHGDLCLLMTRRGVSILQCLQLTLEEIEQRREYQGVKWTPARHMFMAQTSPNTLESVSL